jgi:hypothetical protein
MSLGEAAMSSRFGGWKGRLEIWRVVYRTSLRFVLVVISSIYRVQGHLQATVAVSLSFGMYM